MKTEHLLVIRFSPLGDIALLVPAVHALARQYPALRITVLSRPVAAPLFDGIADNVGFMGADLKREYHGLHGLNALYRRLMAKHFTAVADMNSILKSEYLRMRFNIDRYRVAHLRKNRSLRRRLIPHNNKVSLSAPFSLDACKTVLARLGYPIDPCFQSLFPPERASLRTLPAPLNERKAFQQWIGMAPLADADDPESHQQIPKTIIQLLIQRHPSCRILLFAQHQRQFSALDEIIALAPMQCINASKTLGGLRQELILMNRLDVMLPFNNTYRQLASLVDIALVEPSLPTETPETLTKKIEAIFNS